MKKELDIEKQLKEIEKLETEFYAEYEIGRTVLYKLKNEVGFKETTIQDRKERRYPLLKLEDKWYYIIDIDCMLLDSEGKIQKPKFDLELEILKKSNSL